MPADTRRQFARAAFGLAGAAAVARAATVPSSINVRDHGAAGNGTQPDTAAIQSTIDLCSRAGGGVVLFPPGTYLSGTLILKSGVRLHLAPGAKLLGSANLADYPEHVPALRSFTDTYTRRSLLYAENAENIGIEGEGEFDGQGASFHGPYLVRPYMFRFIGCRGVSVGGVTIRNSPMWVQHYLDCEDVLIHGIRVHSLVNHNNDGIDIDACRRVRISDCDIVSGDDAIVLKSTTGKPCQDIAVANCVLRTLCNAIKLGTESNGGFQNISLANCTIYDTRLAGIAIECVDGGVLDGVAVSNITMRAVGCPIFVRLGDRGRPFQEGAARPPLGYLRNVTITNVIATGANQFGCSITGMAERAVENITLSHIDLSFAGGGTAGQARRAIPEEREKYPEYKMLGVLPAYGLFCRHARGVVLDDIRVRTETPDARHALVCDDVEDLDMIALHAASQPGAEPVVRLDQVRRAMVRGCRAPEGTGVFLEVGGARSEAIVLAENDLRRAQQSTRLGPSVPKSAVTTLR
jgi:polygalacturonase